MRETGQLALLCLIPICVYLCESVAQPKQETVAKQVHVCVSFRQATTS